MAPLRGRTFGKDNQQRAWNSESASYTQACGSDIMDATALLFPILPVSSSVRPHSETYVWFLCRGLVYRYGKGKIPHEGAFAVCSFWEVDFSCP